MTSAMLFRFMMNFIIRSSYFQRKKTFFLLNLLFFLSCSPSVIALKHAPDLTEEGFGFYISRIERKIQNSPDNIDLLLKASKYITMRGFAFQIEKANQYKFTDLDKASSYYKQALVLFEKAIELKEQFPQVIFLYDKNNLFEQRITSQLNNPYFSKSMFLIDSFSNLMEEFNVNLSFSEIFEDLKVLL